MDFASRTSTLFKAFKIAILLAVLITPVIYFCLSMELVSPPWLLPSNFKSIELFKCVITETNKSASKRTKIKDILVQNDTNYKVTTNVMLNMEIPSFVQSSIPVANCNNTKFLVYRCSSVCGGFGDREKGITTTFLLALLTNRTYVILMHKPCELGMLLKPNLYDWTKCRYRLSNKTSKRISYMHKRFLHKLPRTNYDEIWKEEVIYIKSNVIAMEKIRQHPNTKHRIPWLYYSTLEEGLGYLLGILFRVNESIHRHAINKLTSAKDTSLVCAHIRYGKNPSNANDNKLKRGPPNVEKIMTFLANFSDQNKYTIYVATDSDDVKKEAKNRFPNLLVDSGRIMHVDRSRGQGVDGCVGFETVIREQFLLSRCDTLILTRSNFGAMAAYLRGHSKNLYLYYKPTDKIRQVNISMINILNEIV